MVYIQSQSKLVLRIVTQVVRLVLARMELIEKAAVVSAKKAAENVRIRSSYRLKACCYKDPMTQIIVGGDDNCGKS